MKLLNFIVSIKLLEYKLPIYNQNENRIWTNQAAFARQAIYRL